MPRPCIFSWRTRLWNCIDSPLVEAWKRACRLAAIAGAAVLVPCHVVKFLQLIFNFFYTLRSTKVKGGILVSPCLSVCPSICGQNHVRSVSSTILAGSISYLHILSGNFRRCVASKVFFKIEKFEVLANGGWGVSSERKHSSCCSV